MRILITTGNASVAGGGETHLQVLIAHLHQRGHTVALLATTEAVPGRPLVAPPEVQTWSAVDRPVQAVLADLTAWKPDVAYGHGSALDVEVSERFGMVYFAHNYLGACISGSKCHSLPGPVPCSQPLAPMCLAQFLPRRCGGLNPLTALRQYRQGRRWQRALGSYRAVLVDSRHMAAEMIRNHVPVQRVHVNPPFPTSIAPDIDPPRPRAWSNRILLSGRLTWQKGWSHLVEALPRAGAALGRRMTLVVVGDGPDREQIRTMGARAGLEVELLGWVHAARRNAEMRQADLLAVPSLWPEPFGLSGIEAGCAGTPAVGYAVGGIPDWLVPGVSGESADGAKPEPQALANALVRALGDRDHWQRLRHGAWETACRFSPEAHVDRLLPILEAAAA
jgi:glycosyltransferase involved in cell wall biosynthesis